jgi:hypothetical protein
MYVSPIHPNSVNESYILEQGLNYKSVFEKILRFIKDPENKTRSVDILSKLVF